MKLHIALPAGINNSAWFRRIRGFRLVYTPLVAIVIFTVMMTIILGTLQMQERNQQENALFRELSLVKQRIQLRFANNTEVLMSLSRDLGRINSDEKTKASALKEAESFLLNNREISQLILLDRDNQRQWMMPPPSRINTWFDRAPYAKELQAQLNKTIELTVSTNRPAFSNFIQIDLPNDEPMAKERRTIFWQTIPIGSDGEVSGVMAVLYSAQGVMEYVIPPELKGLYRFSLTTDVGKVLAISSDRNMPPRSLTNQTSLDLGILSPNAILRVDTYPTPSNLTFKMLLGVVIGLSAFVILSLWSVIKQMQVRQLAEASLRTETNFRNAMENSTPVGIRAHDMQKRITYVNRAFCEMTDWSSEELIGLGPPFPFWPADQQEGLLKKMDLALNASSHHELKGGIEGVIQRRDGTRIATRTYIAPLISEKGEQTGWVTSLVDISEPKRIREELAASQDRFITVLEGLDAAVSVISIETGELLFANRFYRERFGNTSQGHIDLANHEMDPALLHSLEADNIDPLAGLPDSELNQSRQTESQEIQLIGEESKWYEVRRRFIPWVDGHLAQLLIATDITLRKNTEDLAREQEERMQFTSRLTTMGEMASSLAHELNQPLAAISNYCMGVAKRLSGQADQTLSKDLLPALEKASQQAHRAGTIIQRIRGFVKRSEPQRKDSDIADIVADAVGLVEIEAHRHRLSITAELAPNLPKVALDPVLIQQVLVNLLKNSLDSVREAAPLSSRWAVPPIKISADLETSTFPAMLRIQVIDSGPGVADGVIERMFEPFFSTKSDGMGMGLNICRSIIESHHGRLWAKNQHDPNSSNAIGCTFTILLPLETAETEANALA
jgi:PAS domain S-box-containing protein